MLIVEFVFIFEAVFQNNSNYCVLVGHAYVLSFRPVALQIRTIPGRVGSGGKHWVIMLASPAKLGLGLSLAIDDQLKKLSISSDAKAIMDLNVSAHL